jgi:hypothetical protein
MRSQLLGTDVIFGESEHEITCDQALRYSRFAQDKRQPGGPILEGTQGRRDRAGHDPIGARYINRCGAPTKQPVIVLAFVRFGLLQSPVYDTDGCAKRPSGINGGAFGKICSG